MHTARVLAVPGALSTYENVSIIMKPATQKKFKRTTRNVRFQSKRSERGHKRNFRRWLMSICQKLGSDELKQSRSPLYLRVTRNVITHSHKDALNVWSYIHCRSHKKDQREDFQIGRSFTLRGDERLREKSSG